ncbi:MAG: CoA transferase subunit A, partial [Methylocystis sp.]
HTALYHAAARESVADFKTRYLDAFVYGVSSHEAYIESIGGDATRAHLASWTEGDDAWMRLYLDEPVA